MKILWQYFSDITNNPFRSVGHFFLAGTLWIMVISLVSLILNPVILLFFPQFLIHTTVWDLGITIILAGIFHLVIKTIMNKNISRKYDAVSILNTINRQLYPHVLGFWSDNNGGWYVVTNTDCTSYRGLGSRQWHSWDNNPGYLRPYNEYLEVVSSGGLGSDMEALKIYEIFLERESLGEK